MKAVISPNPYRDKNLRYALEAKTILEKAGIETAICLAFEVDKDFALPKHVELKDMERELQDSDVLIYIPQCARTRCKHRHNGIHGGTGDNGDRHACRARKTGLFCGRAHDAGSVCHS